MLIINRVHIIQSSEENAVVISESLEANRRRKNDVYITTGLFRKMFATEDLSEGALVYDPGHPDADEAGYVRMPNVNITDEMLDMMDARRLFEANASVFQAIKSMMYRATQL